MLYLFDFVFFFFNDTATTEIYTLSLHDALPILATPSVFTGSIWIVLFSRTTPRNSIRRCWRDRKSTRLNSSHGYISYAVFCLKKKQNTNVAPSPSRNNREPWPAGGPTTPGCCQTVG